MIIKLKKINQMTEVLFRRSIINQITSNPGPVFSAKVIERYYNYMDNGLLSRNLMQCDIKKIRPKRMKYILTKLSSYDSRNHESVSLFFETYENLCDLVEYLPDSPDRMILEAILKNTNIINDPIKKNIILEKKINVLEEELGKLQFIPSYSPAPTGPWYKDTYTTDTTTTTADWTHIKPTYCSNPYITTTMADREYDSGYSKTTAIGYLMKKRY